MFSLDRWPIARSNIYISRSYLDIILLFSFYLLFGYVCKLSMDYSFKTNVICCFLEEILLFYVRYFWYSRDYRRIYIIKSVLYSRENKNRSYHKMSKALFTGQNRAPFLDEASTVSPRLPRRYLK